ncbi:MAG: 50S ribosomal protein L15 [Planctomycetota bacterium]|nr:50S ribosomal protein L15 [Planctomycetota bacterium]
MNLDDVKKIKVKRSKKHRVGRGPGSGWGTTAGRGNKGAGQRSGTSFRLHFEGGQMPLYRRLPKKGFTNARFKVDMHVVNVGDLEGAFEAGSKVTLDELKRVGLAPKRAKYLKVLGFGDLTKALTIEANGVSAGARTKIEAVSGSIEVSPTSTVMRPKFTRKSGAAGKNRTPDSEA